MSKWLLVVNPKSAGGRTARRIPAVVSALKRSRCFDIEVAETRAKGHASEIVAEAAAQNWDGILSLGGDGTHNEVLNGFIDSKGAVRRENLALGVLPAGSGGDFARLIYPTRDPVEAADFLNKAKLTLIDVGRCELLDEGRSRCFLNVASLGMGAEVVRMANRGRKLLGGRLTYQLTIVKTALRYKQQPVHIKIDEVFQDTQKVRMVAIANGRFVGGGMRIAPEASLEDGLFDVVIIGEMSGMATIRNSPKLRKGTHLEMPEVQLYQGSEVDAEVSPDGDGPVYVELDGEEVGHLPARFHILPGCLPFLMPQRIPDDG